jgi:N-succinyldiaminopimelate aminotransferase
VVIQNSVLAALGTTIFETNTRLAIEHGSVNLGQGFPDNEGPQSMKNLAATYTNQQSNQYPPMMGLPILREAVSKHAKQFYDIDSDWKSEVLITSGATEALAATFFGLLNPGDNVILLEPLYDAYVPLIRLVGATPKPMRLSPPNWSVDFEALEKSIDANTRMLVLNNPMNPTGKAFTHAELLEIARISIKHDLIVVCDEVYEHLVFDNRPHIPLVTIDGMRNRCVRISSSGKIFSFTGWKVGFILTSEHLLKTITKAHQFLVFTTPPNLQAAVAFGLENEQQWYTSLASRLQQQRDYLSTSLTELDFSVLPSEATYFLTVDITNLTDQTDQEFCANLTIDGGVTGVPVSAFYEINPPTHLLRFCFCKKMSVLSDAIERLTKWRTQP